MNYYTLQFPSDQPQQPQQVQPQPAQFFNVSKEATEEMAQAQIRQLNAQTRITEAQAASAEAIVKMNQAQILLNGMHELRCALNMPSVDEQQSGVGDNPKLRPMFTPDQIEALQLHYLQAYKKFEDFSDEVIKQYKSCSPIQKNDQ